jgi:hypothetical protein
MKLSPTPWTVGIKGDTIHDANGMQIADWSFRVRATDNAKLSAAAPDLLVAAERLIASLQLHIAAWPNDAKPVFDGAAELQAAIAKARR